MFKHFKQGFKNAVRNAGRNINLLAVITCSVSFGLSLANHDAMWAVIFAVFVSLNAGIILKRLTN